MPGRTWVLADVAGGVYTPEFSLTGEEIGAELSGFSVNKQVLRGGLADGVEEIRVQNGDFSFAVLPTRGMGIWKAWLGDWELGWKSPVRGPVHPKFVPVAEPSGLGWLDGFDELLVRCGLESNGSPEFEEAGRLKYPLHGRIANRPAHRVELRIDSRTREVALMGVVEETRFLFTNLRLTSTISTTIGSSIIRVRDEVENLASREAQMQLLYHINLGAPLLEEGAQALVPVRMVAPRTPRAAEGIDAWNEYGAPQSGFAEQVYFFDLHADADENTAVLLKNAGGSRGFSIRFNKRQLPWFILWRNSGALEDGYVTGLEPSTNFPNPRTFEGKHGRVVNIPPGGKATFELQLEIHGDARSVQEMESRIRRLQTAGEPEVLKGAPADWAPPS
jgi:hypothetical protein